MLIPLKQSILVYLLPFSFLEFLHYSVSAITKQIYEKFSIPGRNSQISIYKFLSKLLFMSKILTCESLIKDLNGMELNRCKKLKRKSSKTFMEKTANVNLALKAILIVNAVGMRK